MSARGWLSSAKGVLLVPEGVSKGAEKPRRYAAATREIKPIEQRVHSLLEMLLLTVILTVVALCWSKFKSLLGFGFPAIALQCKDPPLPLPARMADRQTNSFEASDGGPLAADPHRLPRPLSRPAGRLRQVPFSAPSRTDSQAIRWDYGWFGAAQGRMS